jgi:hypothetical protein
MGIALAIRGKALPSLLHGSDAHVSIVNVSDPYVFRLAYFKIQIPDDQSLREGLIENVKAMHFSRPGIPFPFNIHEDFSSNERFSPSFPVPGKNKHETSLQLAIRSCEQRIAEANDAILSIEHDHPLCLCPFRGDRELEVLGSSSIGLLPDDALEAHFISPAVFRIQNNLALGQDHRLRERIVRYRGETGRQSTMCPPSQACAVGITIAR